MPKFTPRLSFEILEDRTTPTFLPDPSFGAGGLVTMGVGTRNASWSQVAVQPDGQIVVFTGYNNDLVALPDRVTSSYRITPSYDELLRFNADGSLDPTFGTGGVVQLPTDASAGVMAVASDGQIYVGTTVNSVATVYRFNPNGTPDTTYGVGGAVTVDIGGASLTVEALTLTPDGKIVVAGTMGPAWTAEYGVARLNSNGTLDTTFNKTGLFSYTFTWWDSAQVKALTVTPTGELIFNGSLGWTAPPGPPGTVQPDIAFGENAVLELTPDGTLDSQFNGSGVATSGPSTPEISALINADLLVSSQNGNILSLGCSVLGSSVDGLVVYQLNADGSPDTRFGTGGSVTIPYPPGFVPLAGTQSLALLPDGRIVVSVVTATQTWVTVLNPDGSAEPGPDGSASVPIEFGGEPQYYWNFDGGLAVTPSGQIIVAATRTEDTISNETQLELAALTEPQNASPASPPATTQTPDAPPASPPTDRGSSNGPANTASTDPVQNPSKPSPTHPVNIVSPPKATSTNPVTVSSASKSLHITSVTADSSKIATPGTHKTTSTSLASNDSKVSGHDKVNETDLAVVPNDNAPASSGDVVAENNALIGGNSSDAIGDVQLKLKSDLLGFVGSQFSHTKVYLSPVLIDASKSSNKEEEEDLSSFDTLDE